jgi:hypothetical protein
VFVSGKPFQSSLLLAGKAGAYPQTLDKAERLARHKHSGLLRKCVHYSRKKFNSIYPFFIIDFHPGVRPIKLLFFFDDIDSK